jgi:hypothetical protein
MTIVFFFIFLLLIHLLVNNLVLVVSLIGRTKTTTPVPSQRTKGQRPVLSLPPLVSSKPRRQIEEGFRKVATTPAMGERRGAILFVIVVVIIIIVVVIAIVFC